MADEAPVLTASESLREAEAAELRTEWDVAAQHYEACLTQLESATEAVDEAAVLTALGRCYWRLAQARPAWRTLLRAITMYRERDDAPGMANATIELLRIWGPPDRQRALADDALAALGESEPALRARLLARNWRWEEAIPIAEAHNVEDVLIGKLEQRAWQTFDEGNLEESLALRHSASEEYRRLGNYEGVAYSLRNAAFGLLVAGHLDRGEAAAREAFEYGRSVHLLFTEQLALLDIAGVAYARGQFERCHALLAESSQELDFRGDLYRMWMAADGGDLEKALELMVDPGRAGGAPGPLAQVHAGRAGVLFAAGQENAARHEMQAAIDGARADDNEFVDVLAAMAECFVALADEATVREVYDVWEKGDREHKIPFRFSTLQGRNADVAHGMICERLGLRDEAERHYRSGLDWCERERCAADAQRCLAGLARVAAGG